MPANCWILTVILATLPLVGFGKAASAQTGRGATNEPEEGPRLIL